MGHQNRIAGIDIGSNAIRFILVEFVSGEDWRVLQQTRTALRLGHDVFQTGAVSSDSIQILAQAMSDAAVAMRSAGCSLYRAVATSALRESTNGSEVIAAVRQQSGIEIETISGDEEARLVYTAIHDRLDLTETPELLVDLGGGSLELSRIDRTGIYDTESFRIGAVRLVEAHQSVEQMLQILDSSKVLATPFELMVATGGNMEALALIANARRNNRGVSELRPRDLESAIEQLSGLTAEQRQQRWRLDPDRADVILPAALVYREVARRAKAERIVVPNVGVKEGIVLGLHKQA